MTKTRPNRLSVLRRAVFILVCLVVGPSSAWATDYLVRDQASYEEALDRAEPGDRILLADGVWEDFEIVFEATGTPDQPIYLMAQTPGSVILTGQSNLRIGGEYLVVWGLTFRDGYSPTSEVISFRRDSRTLAHHTRLVETVIENFNKPDRETQDSWVVVYGQNNRIDRNAFVGKTNRGPTMVVRLNSEDSQNNSHLIERNYFGPRPPLGGNGGETLRIGVSQYSRTHSGTVVRENYFDRCDGEVEIISIKSQGNLITENVFFESRGSVVFRHGGQNEVSRNVFLGNGVSDTGGIRVINDNQVIRDNYLEGLRGRKFLGALVVMNGVPDSPVNRYHQVDNALIQNNSFVDILEMGFGVGSDDERSATPISSAMSNNILLSDEEDPLGVFDDVSGIEFDNNFSNNRRFEAIGSQTISDFSLARHDNGLVYLDSPSLSEEIGAPRDLEPIARAATGPRYFEKPPQVRVEGAVLEIEASEAALIDALGVAADGDVIRLAAGEITLSSPLLIDRVVTVEGVEGASLVSSSAGMFRVVAGGELTLRRLALEQASAHAALIHAVGDQYRGAYRVRMVDIRIHTQMSDGTGAVLTADNATFAQEITFQRVHAQGLPAPIVELSGEGLSGWYMADEIRIDESHFARIGGPLVRFGREGRDESTFGPRFSLTNSVLSAVGRDGLAIDLDGIDGLDLSGNEFVSSGHVRVKRRVLGLPFQIAGNHTDPSTGLTLIGVNDEPLDATLEGGAP
jgi:poly(beta-D-mannuronate) lyase